MVSIRRELFVEQTKMELSHLWDCNQNINWNLADTINAVLYKLLQYICIKETFKGRPNFGNLQNYLRNLSRLDLPQHFWSKVSNKSLWESLRWLGHKKASMIVFFSKKVQFLQQIMQDYHTIAIENTCQCNNILGLHVYNYI